MFTTFMDKETIAKQEAIAKQIAEFKAANAVFIHQGVHINWTPDGSLTLEYSLTCRVPDKDCPF